MIYPKRPQAHITGDRAVDIFVSKCDRAWVISPIKEDYGLDLRIEVTKSEFVSGEEFFVQIKGRKHASFDEKLLPEVKIKQTTINYWLNKLAPTLIALV